MLRAVLRGRPMAMLGVVVYATGCSTPAVHNEPPSASTPTIVAVESPSSPASGDALEDAIVRAIKEVRSEEEWRFSIQLLDDGSPQTLLDGLVLWIGAYRMEAGADLEELCADVLALALELQPRFQRVVVTDSLSLVERELDRAFTYCEP